MARKNYSVDEVLKSLRSKNDVRVEFGSIRILTDNVYDPAKDEVYPNPNKKHDLGNGSWGKIDFLRKKLGYPIVHVEKFRK